MGHHHLPLATISSVIRAPWLRKEDLLLRIYFFTTVFMIDAGKQKASGGFSLFFLVI